MEKSNKKPMFCFLVIFILVITPCVAQQNYSVNSPLEKTWKQESGVVNHSHAIEFVNLNPVFFGNNHFQINFLENISQNTNPQNNQNLRSGSQNNWLSFFGFLGMQTLSAFANSSMDSNERSVYRNTWEQQAERERFYQRIHRDRNRNIYRFN